MTVQQYLIIHAAEWIIAIVCAIIAIRLYRRSLNRKMKKRANKRTAKDLAIQYAHLFDDIHFPDTGIKDRTDALEKKYDSIDKVIFLSENALVPRIQELEKLVKELQEKA